MASRERELAALLVLLRRRPEGAGWNEIVADVVSAGSAVDILNAADSDALFASPEHEGDLSRAEAEVLAWRSAGLATLTVLDNDYPLRLLSIRETPPFLFYEGSLRERDEGICVVGSRSASPWGLKLAADVARFLVSEGLTVISGLAQGIDTAAHQSALDEGGRTVAVLGTGINIAYPSANRNLQRLIASRGLLLSQFFPDAPGTRQSFPMRNATMSGYGLATIVIEAGETSGTRIQARAAGEHGRPVILTSKVADSTSWGEALRGRSGVYVVSSFQELTDAVRDVREAPERLRRALDELKSA